MVHESLTMIANLTYQDLLRFHMSSTGLTQPLQSSLSLPWKGKLFKVVFSILNVLTGNALKAFVLDSIFVAYYNKTPIWQNFKGVQNWGI